MGLKLSWQVRFLKDELKLAVSLTNEVTDTLRGSQAFVEALMTRGFAGPDDPSRDPQLGVIESHIKHPSIGFLELIGSSLRISCLLSPPDILRNQAANESLSDSRQPTAGQGETKSQRKDLMKLVANKTEIPAKIPQYDGLERWELLEKMGAGGFSTVYRAQDLDGKAGEVAD
ncbi:hypothetical protein B0T10DRAFT_468124 [Thelonectria olida]|uniref:Protein kinase domain-containing protein n=1 Tax=Thelonectria olida TaxID=1576542 RepID=A0A9P9AG27_9HYPO|nr:hypothetical protein B0T10DRAFT_468124 [Thelonectria olida]